MSYLKFEGVAFVDEPRDPEVALVYLSETGQQSIKGAEVSVSLFSLDDAREHAALLPLIGKRLRITVEVMPS